MKKLITTCLLCTTIILTYYYIYPNNKTKIKYNKNKQYIEINNKSLPNNKCLKLLITLDPECPLSISYSSTINKLATQYSDCDSTNIDFLIILPSESSLKNIKYLERIYKPTLQCWDTIPNDVLNNSKLNQMPPLYLDYNHDIINIIDAKITPECFLIDPQGQIIYSGAIDNWVSEIGKTKQYTNEHYLEDAITQYLNNEIVKKPKKTAIGCIIQR